MDQIKKRSLLDNLKNIAALIGVIGTIGGTAFGAYKFTERIHSDKQHVIEAEEFFNSYDEKKAYGEYIMDSIEEVNTQRWRKLQMHKDSLIELKIIKMDSLLRLNIRISDEAYKAYKSQH